MANCSVKIYNPNPYDVIIKTANGPDKAPDGSLTISAGKTESRYFPEGKWLQYDKVTKNRYSPALGQVQYNNQIFTVPPVSD